MGFAAGSLGFVKGKTNLYRFLRMTFMVDI